MNESIKKTSERLRSGEITSVELTQECLNVAEKAQSNSMISVFPEEALRQAEEADERIKNGDENPLCGIPFSMKDSYLTKGLRTTSGSGVLGNYKGQYSATVYEKLREKGAVLIGKNNQDAWGHGASSENNDFGPVKNPWDQERVAGGSSGGSAASVIEGSSMFSIGEDTGGSIRNPSSFCNTTGLKVTYGRVSRYGTIAYASSLDTVGPITRSVEDVAVVLQSIAGFDPKDASSSHEEVPDYEKGLKEVKALKIGLMKEYMGDGLDGEVRKRIEEMASVFEDLGVGVEEVSVPLTKYGVSIYYVLALSETSSNLARFDGIRYGQERGKFTEETKRRIMMGTHALSSGYYDAYYRQALKARTKLIEQFNKAFERVDAILAPVMPFPAYKFGEMGTDVAAMYLADLYTCATNPAGIPSLSVPAGFSEGGLPIGAQIMGPMFSEPRVLSLGYAFQQKTDHHLQRP